MAQRYKHLFKRQSYIIYCELILTMKSDWVHMSKWKSLYGCLITLGNEGFDFHYVFGDTQKYWNTIAGVNGNVVWVVFELH